MSEIVLLVEDALEGDVIARARGHSIFAEADTYEELREVVRGDVQCHFDNSDRPKVIRLQYATDEVVAA